MAQKPVIFLAYANDKTEDGVYLRNLTVEMHGIRNALSEAAKNGLCEIVERSSATISDIMDVFQDPVYHFRVAIFHYAGHADGNALLLEALDGSNSLAHKEGLVDLLSRQDGLRLVFLNGCSSEGQTDALLAAGVPAVIGTTSSINDNIATQLAIGFYKGIGFGSGIEKSWLDALSEIKITVGSENTRALNWAGKKNEDTGVFPWIMKFRSGAEIVKKWNLPETAGNPLFGLPAAPQLSLPESPFVYINKFSREYADVFFGRSKYIRELYFKVTDLNAPPVILLYGQSGVGKSSLLEAGLTPRLENNYEVIFIRRNDFLGLSKTLFQTLVHKCGFEDPDILTDDPGRAKQLSMVNSLELIDQDLNSEAIKADIERIRTKIKEKYAPITATPEDEQMPHNLLEAWKLTETLFKKPLVVIFDQFEEVFTRPNKELTGEVADFFNNLKQTFGNRSIHPDGKIILSFVKGYQPEIEEHCNIVEISRSRVFLDNLEKEDIVSLFSELTNDPRLKFTYNITIEGGLGELIASDYTRSRSESTVGPALQILLTKLWNKAQALNKGNPVFSRELYRDMEEGVAMEEFLHSQLAVLNQHVPLAYSSGLAIDLLLFHCTPNNTSGLRTEEEIFKHYPGPAEIIQETLDYCKALLLLVNASGVGNATTLSHDSLASEVVKDEKRSARPVQQANRILNSKIEILNSGATQSMLNQSDLDIITAARPYMRELTDKEKKLIADSRVACDKEKRVKTNLTIARWSVIIISLFAAVIVSISYVKTLKDRKRIFMSLKAAESSLFLGRDNTMALFMAAEGYEAVQRDWTMPVVKESITTAFYTALHSNTPLYKSYFSGNHVFLNVLYNADKQFFIPLPQDSTAGIYSFDDSLMTTLSCAVHAPYEKPFLLLKSAKLTLDNVNIAGLGSDSVLRVWDLSGKNVFESDHRKRIICFDYSYTKDKYLIVYKDTIEIFDLSTRVSQKIRHVEKFSKAIFSPDAAKVLISPVSGQLKLLSVNTNQVRPLDYHDAPVKIAFFSHVGSLILASYADSVFVLWDTSGKQIVFPKQDSGIINFEFHPSDTAFVVCTGYEANLYLTRGFPSGCVNIKSKDLAQAFIHVRHDDFVTFARFSPSGTKLMTGSSDNTGYVWSLTEERKKLLGHRNDLTAGFFSKDEKTAFTTSLDGTVKSWDLNMFHPPILRGHKGPVLKLQMSPDSTHLCSVGKDSMMLVWELGEKENILVTSLKLNELIYEPVFSKNSSKIMGITSTNRAFVWDWKGKAPPVFMAGHTKKITGGSFLGNDTLVTVSDDNTIRYWNVSGNCFKVVNSIDDSFSCQRFANDEKIMVVGTYNGMIYMLNDTGKIIDTLIGHKKCKAIISCRFSRDDKKLVSASEDNTAIIWDLKKKHHVVLDKAVEAPYYKFKINAARFSLDGQYVLTASSDRAARVWNIDGTLKATLFGHSDNVRDAKFTPYNRVFTVSDDRKVKYWLADGTPLATYSNNNIKINDVVIDRTGEKLLAALDDGTIHIWYTARGVFNWVKDYPSYKYYKNHRPKPEN